MGAPNGELPEDVGIDYDPGPEAPANAVAEALLRHESELLALPNVTGVGIGQNSIGDPAIVVYLRVRSARANLPERIDGYDVVAEVTGEIDAY